MPADEYASVVRGGLKLKGGAPSGVVKKKKKSKDKDKKALAAAVLGESESAAGTELIGQNGKGKDVGRVEVDVHGGERGAKKAGLEDVVEKGNGEGEEEGDTKTASERAYEEMRRRRLHERLEKEGVKTHKQRVEELNKYLSNLSEHHDMPRIGPG